jgi:hypothetical protein
MDIDYRYGIDVAIKKLRPNASFQLENQNITLWEDPTGSEPPSWDEIYRQLEIDRKAHDEHYGITEFHRVSVNYGPPEEDDKDQTSSSKKRIEICISCDRLMSKHFKVCKECGCYVPWKTKLESTSCPLGKW